MASRRRQQQQPQGAAGDQQLFFPAKADATSEAASPEEVSSASGGQKHEQSTTCDPDKQVDARMAGEDDPQEEEQTGQSEASAWQLHNAKIEAVTSKLLPANTRKSRNSVKAMVRHARSDSQLKHLTQYEWSVKVVSGVTAEQRVTQDKKSWIDGKLGPMGAEYYSAILRTYKDLPDADQELERLARASDKSKPIKPHIYKHSVRWIQNPKCRAGLISAFENCTSLQRCEYCCMGKLLVSLKATCDKQRIDMVQLMRVDFRTKAHQHDPDIHELLVPYYEGCLLQCWSAGKSKTTPAQFLNDYGNCWGLCMDKAVVERLTTGSASWHDHAADLYMVTASQLGESLFSFALDGIIHENISKSLELHVSRMFQANVTQDTLIQHKEACLQAIERNRGLERIQETRMVTLFYGMVRFETKVLCNSDLVDKQFASAIHRAGVINKLIDPISAESILLGSGQKELGFGVQVEDSLLIQTMAARRHFEKLQRRRANQKLSVSDLLVVADVECLERDKYWCIERDMLKSLSGASGHACLRKEATQLLQSTQALETVTQEMGQLCSSALFHFCAEDAQGEAISIRDALDALLMNTAPSWGQDSTDPFVVQISDSFAALFSVNVGTERFHGKAGYRSLASKLHDSLKQEVLDSLAAWKQFMPADAAGDVSNFLSKKRSAAGGATLPTKKAKVGSSSSSSKSGNHGKRDHGKKDFAAKAMALFGR